MDEAGFDSIITLLLIFFGLVSRTWCINNPEYIVPTERHYGNIVNCILKGEFFVDSNPPLGCFILSGFGWANCYHADIEFSKSPYFFNNKVFPTIRFTSAFFSAFVPVIVYWILRFSKNSCFVSFAGSMMIVFETSFISESRIIGIHGIFLFFISFSLLLVTFKPQSSSIFVNLGYSVLCGVFFGLSISTKLQALLLFPYYAVFLYVNHNRYRLYQFITSFIVSVLVLFTVLVLQIAVTPFESDKKYDIWPEMQMRLIDRIDYAVGDIDYTNRMNSEPILCSAFKLLCLIIKQKPPQTQTSRWYLFPLGLGSVSIMWQNNTRVFATYANFFNVILGTGSIPFMAISNMNNVALLVLYILSLLYLVVLGSASASDYSLSLILSVICFSSCLKKKSYINRAIISAGLLLSFIGFCIWNSLSYGLPNTNNYFGTLQITNV